MNILVVHVADIGTCPPVRNIVTILAELGHTVTVLTRNRYNIELKDKERIRIILLPENKYHGVFRIFNYTTRIRVLRRIFDQEMKNHDILWTTSDSTVRELKGRVLKYKHIMQLMELAEDIPQIMTPSLELFHIKIPPIGLFPIHMKKYAQKAYKVVVPEYNRAHIQKVWWDLKDTPIVLPNKPVEDVIDEKSIPDEAKEIIDGIKKETRKIILYQGVFSRDRNFEMYAEALKPFSNQYCFCLLGRDNDYRKKICKQFPEVRYLGFLPPPYHLLITSLADIALLPYVPMKCDHLSVLNALYCAPNKIYEYAKYGIPMIGNDVPGLQLPFDKYGIGCIYHGSGAEEMRAILDKLDADYQRISESCHKFYDDTDLYRIVEDIIS